MALFTTENPAPSCQAGVGRVSWEWGGSTGSHPECFGSLGEASLISTGK